jgi:hypothetical protein
MARNHTSVVMEADVGSAGGELDYSSTEVRCFFVPCCQAPGQAPQILAKPFSTTARQVLHSPPGLRSSVNGFGFAGLAGDRSCASARQLYTMGRPRLRGQHGQAEGR